MTELYELPTSTRSRRRALLATGAAGLTVVLFLAASVCVSRFAHQTQHPVELGAPLWTPFDPALRATTLGLGALAVTALIGTRRWTLLPLTFVLYVFVALAASTSVYSPYPLAEILQVRHDPVYGPVLAEALWWGFASFAALLASCLPFSRAAFRLVRTGDLHGSARFATPRDIIGAGFVVDDHSSSRASSAGLPIGELRFRGRDALVRVLGDVHLLLFAPPGSGKTTKFVIPTGQDWQGNLVALDVKGEVWGKTAGWRAQAGNRILVVDPSRDEPHLARWNPMLSVRDWPFDVQDVSELALLLNPNHAGADPFWRESARSLMEGLLLHCLYASPEKTLAACYYMLSSPLIPLFEGMKVTQHDPLGQHGWITHPRVAAAAQSFLDMPEQTRGGVIANCLTALAPYSDPILAAATATSDFLLTDLFAGDRPCSLYLTIDPNSLARLSNHMRIVVSQIVSALTRELPPPGRRPTLLLLDEFPALGRMEILEKALAYLRGYGVQAFIVVQHTDQLNALYGQTESVSPNCSVFVAFAPAHLPTAKALSARAGTRTVQYERDSQGGKGGASYQGADTGRPLLQPDEIMRLPTSQALVLRVGTRPLLVRPRPYFLDPFRARAASLPAPGSEPTHPDHSRWMSRVAPAPAHSQPAAARRPRLARTLEALK